MNRRLQNLIDKGMIPNKGGVFIDSYNQSINEEIAGTITTRVDASNMSFVTEPKIIERDTPMKGNYTEPIIIDDYNQRVPQDQYVIGTVTTQFGNPAYKIAEPLRIPQATKQGYIEVPQGAVFDMSYPESTTRRGRVQEGGQVSPTLMAGGEAPCYYEGIKNMTNEEEGLFKDSNKTYSGEILRLLQQKIGEETYKWAIGRFRYILKKEILQSGLHEEIFCKERENESRLFASSSHVKKDSVSCTTETNGVRDVRFDNEHRCSSQGFQLSEQFTGEFNDIVQKLSHENPSTKTIMSNLWESCGQQGSLQQTLFEVEEIWESFNCKREVSYRIRKLTPREVFRLMGVTETDIDKIQQSGVSQSQQYKMAGNSIVVDVLEHIFRKMFVDKHQESQQLSLF